MTTSETDAGSRARRPVVVVQSRESRPTGWLVAIFVVGLLARIVAALLFGATEVEGLTRSYAESAQALLDGDPFLVAKGTEILHPYGYSVLMILVGAFAGSEREMLAGLTGVQVCLDVAAIWFVYVIGRALHSRRAGLWAAATYALNPLIVLAVVQPMPEALSPLLVVSLLASMTAMWRSQRRWGLWAGVVCGVAYYFRSEFVLLPAVVCVYVVMTGRLRSEARQLAVIAITTTGLIAPMVVGTWAETGTPRVNTTNAGGTMWQSLGEEPGNPWGLRLGDDHVAAEADRLGFPSPWGPEANGYFTDEWVSAVRRHPAAYAELVVAHRVPEVFDTQMIRWNYAEYAMGLSRFESAQVRYADLRSTGRTGELLTDPRMLILTAPAGWVLRATALLCFLGFAAYLVTYRGDRRRVLIVALPFTYFVVSLCLVKFVEPRQFFVLLPLYSFAGGVMLSRAAARMTSRRPPETPRRRGEARS